MRRAVVRDRSGRRAFSALVEEKTMKRSVLIPLSLLLAGALVATAAPAQNTSSEAQRHRHRVRTETQRDHQARHRVAPPVERYRGPRDYRPGRRPPQLYRPPAFEPRQYRRNYRAERRYRGPRYIRPRGWYFHRWIFGDILPTLFWSRNYWIVDYWRYGLPIPPVGYVWVRYGDDALLIDETSGEILQVIYGIFY